MLNNICLKGHVFNSLNNNWDNEPLMLGFVFIKHKRDIFRCLGIAEL